MTEPLSPGVDGFAEAGWIPLSPALDTNAPYFAVPPLSPGIDEVFEQAPTPLGPAFDIIAPFPPPPTYGWVVSGVVAASPPVRQYGGPTGGRKKASLPTRFFSGTSDGIVGGLPAPINLTATVVDAGCIRLDWVDPGPDEDGFRIERSLSGLGTWVVIGTVLADITTFLDRFAVPLVVYDYRVISFDAVRDSLPSSIATAVTQLPPTIPTGPPPTTPVDQQRNQIKPDSVEFKSPGVYGLETDENGNVIGFKY